MKIIQVKDYEELCQKAAQILLQRVKDNRRLRLGLATGGTPVGVYRNMVQDHLDHGTSYREIQTFNLDEYLGLAPDHPQSYHAYMEEHLFRWVDLQPNKTHIPDGKAADPEAECRRYEEMIQQQGGIDLQLLGIGVNGHIGFNEPGTPFDSTTRVVQLAESTRRANARFFSEQEEVPTHAITMGIGTIMKSREILLLASGTSKAPVMRSMLQQEVSEQLPASVLKRHPRAQVIADQDALSLVEEELLQRFR
ncbi:MAG: glucosamine-6-phosphate deaminase [Firmicutes bacterium]|nr:glucosamine-6-phosphate deaminase [Melghirimyces thermohalophilus]MDA8353331.1 glucosamine-6-phosphate deaminase [Bacillota bacterium]